MFIKQYVEYGSILEYVCACACEREGKPKRMQNIKLSSTRLDDMRLLFFPFYFAAFSECFGSMYYSYYQRKWRGYFYSKKKVNWAHATCSAQQRSQGKQDLATRLQKLMAWLTEWGRRLWFVQVSFWFTLEYTLITIESPPRDVHGTSWHAWL